MGVDLGDHHAGALALEGLAAALAHVAVAEHHGHLAAEHHVGGAVEAVDQRVAAAVEVVELALGGRVVDVDGRHGQLAAGLHLVEPVHAGGGLLAHALHAGEGLGEAAGVGLELGGDQVEDDAPFLAVGGGVERRDLAGLLELRALVEQQGEVAAVVEHHVGALAAGEVEQLVGAPPVLLERLALPREDRRALGVDHGAVLAHDHRGGGGVLRAEDVARGPADLRAEFDERLDEHGRLHGHVEAAGDAGAGEGLGRAVLLAKGHEAGHLVLGEADLVAAELGEGQIADLEVEAGVADGGGDGGRRCETHGCSLDGGGETTGELVRVRLWIRRPTSSRMPVHQGALPNIGQRHATR